MFAFVALGSARMQVREATCCTQLRVDFGNVEGCEGFQLPPPVLLQFTGTSAGGWCCITLGIAHDMPRLGADIRRAPMRHGWESVQSGLFLYSQAISELRSDQKPMLYGRHPGLCLLGTDLAV